MIYISRLLKTLPDLPRIRKASVAATKEELVGVERTQNLAKVSLSLPSPQELNDSYWLLTQLTSPMGETLHAMLRYFGPRMSPPNCGSRLQLLKGTVRTLQTNSQQGPSQELTAPHVLIGQINELACELSEILQEFGYKLERHPFLEASQLCLRGHECVRLFHHHRQCLELPLNEHADTTPTPLLGMG